MSIPVSITNGRGTSTELKIGDNYSISVQSAAGYGLTNIYADSSGEPDVTPIASAITIAESNTFYIEASGSLTANLIDTNNNPFVLNGIPFRRSNSLTPTEYYGSIQTTDNSSSVQFSNLPAGEGAPKVYITINTSILTEKGYSLATDEASTKEVSLTTAGPNSVSFKIVNLSNTVYYLYDKNAPVFTDIAVDTPSSKTGYNTIGTATLDFTV